jgi:hypothetical protein
MTPKTRCTIQQQHHQSEAFLDNLLPNLIPYDGDDINDDDDNDDSSNSTKLEEEKEEEGADFAALTDHGGVRLALVVVPSFPIHRLPILLQLQQQQGPTSSLRTGSLNFILQNDNAISHGRRIAVVSALDCCSHLSLPSELSLLSRSPNKINETANHSSRFSLLRKAHSEPLLQCSSQERWMSSITRSTTAWNEKRRRDCAPTIPTRRNHHLLCYMKKANSEPLLLPSSSSQSNNSLPWQSDHCYPDEPSPPLQTRGGGVVMENNNVINKDDNDDESSSESSHRTVVADPKNNKTTTTTSFITSNMKKSKKKKKKNKSPSRSSMNKRAHDCAPKIPQRCRSIIFTCL